LSGIAERFVGMLDAMKLEYSYLEEEDVEVEKKSLANKIFRDVSRKTMI